MKKNKNPDTLIPGEFTFPTRKGWEREKKCATSQDQGWQFISVTQKLHPHQLPTYREHINQVSKIIPKGLGKFVFPVRILHQEGATLHREHSILGTVRELRPQPHQEAPSALAACGTGT